MNLWLPLTDCKSGEIQVSTHLAETGDRQKELSIPGIVTSPGLTTRIELGGEEAKSDEETDIDEEISTENMKTMSDIVKRKLGKPGDEPKYYISTVTEVYQVEEIKEQITGDISNVRTAITRKKIVVIQQTIITIVET